MNRQYRPRWRLALAAALSLAVGAIGVIVPAGSAHATVVVDEPALRNSLFGALMRLKVESPAYDRHLILSAELVGWRATHPAATTELITAHLGAISQSIGASFTHADQRRPAHEQLSRLIQIVYQTPGAEIASPTLTEILASVVRRDRVPGLLTVEHRVSGAQQLVNWESDYLDAQGLVWAEVSARATADAAFRAAWNAGIGAGAGVDAGATPVQLAAAQPLAGLIDVQEIIEEDDPVAFRNALELRFQEQRQQQEQNLAALNALATAASQPASSPAPGGNVPQQPASAVDQAEKDRKERQKYIDGAKSVLDALVTLAGFVDQDLAKRISKFAKGAYALATGINKLITGIKLLGQVAKSFTMAGAFGVMGMLAGGLMDIAGLFGAGSPQDAANAAIRQELAQIKSMLTELGEQMHARFDRIEAALNELYGEMMEQFDNVLTLLAGHGELLAEIQEELMRVETKVQSFGEQILQATANIALDPFLEQANLTLDYADIHSAPMPGHTVYDPAENRFHLTATVTARGAPFVHTAGGLPEDALLFGPSAAIRYLADYARANYDSAFPAVPADVVNPAVWQLAARAYTLLAMQNPELADDIGAFRAGQIAGAGEQVLAAAQTFSAPRAAAPHTNQLFTGLVGSYQPAIVAYANGLRALETHPDVLLGRTFDLFGTVDQVVNPNPLPAPLNVPVCAGSATALPTPGVPSGRVPTPSFANGRQLPNAAILGRLLDNRWQYRSCYANPQRAFGPWEEIRHPVTEKVIARIRDGEETMQFSEFVTFPGGAEVLSRTAPAKRAIFECTGQCDPSGVRVAGDFVANGAAVVDPAGLAQARVEARRALDSRRGIYYGKVAALHAALPDSAGLAHPVRMLRAYTELGFPRALESDDQLRALLYGTSGLPSPLSPATLTDPFSLAAGNLAAGLPALANHQNLEVPGAGDDPCASVTAVNVTTKDPVARCLVLTALLRRDRLAVQYELHFTQIALGNAAQTLPLVDTALRDLRTVDSLVRQP